MVIAFSSVFSLSLLTERTRFAFHPIIPLLLLHQVYRALLSSSSFFFFFSLLLVLLSLLTLTTYRNSNANTFVPVPDHVTGGSDSDRRTTWTAYTGTRTHELVTRGTAGQAKQQHQQRGRTTRPQLRDRKPIFVRDPPLIRYCQLLTTHTPAHLLPPLSLARGSIPAGIGRKGSILL